MRGLPVRRIASTALCASLVLAVAAPAAMAADGDAARERTAAAARASVPDADALLAQVKGLGDLGTVFTPVTDLLNTVLKAEDGQLTPEQATQLGDAAKAGIAKITAAAPVTAPSLPADAASAAPADPSGALPAGTAPSSAKSDDGKARERAAAADPVSDALAALEKQLAALLEAVTSGDVSQVLPAVTDVVNDLVGLLAATLSGAGLSLPSLPSLPVSAPSTPVTPPLLPAAVPSLPAAAPSVPAAAPSLPAAAPSLPAGTLLPAE